MNLKRVGLSLLAGVFSVAALTGTVSQTTVSAQEQEPVVIGVNLELTGAAAPYSVPAVEGLELLVEQVNEAGGVLDGRPLETLVLDNTSNVTEGASISTRLTGEENVAAVLGPNATAVVKSALPSIVDGGLPTVLPATTGDGITLDENGEAYPNVFRTAYEDSYQGSVGAKYALDMLGASNAVMVVDQALDYSQGLADAFKEYFEANGGTVVDTLGYQSGDTDFQALATNLLGQDFDVLYIPGYYTETGLIVQQLRQMGVTQPIVGGDGYASDTFLELVDAEYANDVHYTTHYYANENNPVAVEFEEAFQAKFDKAPDTFAALGYDAAKLVVDAIERAGTTDPEAVNQALAETTDFEGVTGTFSMDEEHNPVKPAMMVTLQNGEVASAEEVSVTE